MLSHASIVALLMVLAAMDVHVVLRVYSAEPCVDSAGAPLPEGAVAQGLTTGVAQLCAATTTNVDPSTVAHVSVTLSQQHYYSHPQLDRSDGGVSLANPLVAAAELAAKVGVWTGRFQDPQIPLAIVEANVAAATSGRPTPYQPAGGIFPFLARLALAARTLRCLSCPARESRFSVMASVKASHLCLSSVDFISPPSRSLWARVLQSILDSHRLRLRRR
jgi:hypothetical protein